MRKTRFLLICFLVLILTACSDSEMTDSLRNQLDGPLDPYINELTVPEANDESGDGKRLFFIGDTIKQYGVEYTLNDIHISDSIDELELDRTSFSSQKQLEANGDIEKGHKLVTLDVTIKNNSAGGYDPDGIHDKPNIFIENIIGFKDDLEDPNGPFTIELSYFSEHPPYERDMWNDYYQFQLGHGEELEARLAWIVQSERLNEESLYYINGSANGPTGTEYWYFYQLSFEGEFFD